MTKNVAFLQRTSLVHILIFSIIVTQNFVFSEPLYSQQTAENFLQEGIAFYDALYIDEAITKLNKAIELGLKNKDDLIKAYKYLAFAYIAKGESDRARECFGRILKLNPLYELDKELSPKILEIFSEAQKKSFPTKITAYRPRSISSPATPFSEIKKKTNPWLITAIVAGLVYLISQAKAPEPEAEVISSFSSVGSGPYGLAWDGQYLWNADNDTDKIYKLNPSTGAVIKSFASPWFSPYGLAWDGQYLWNADNSTDTIYKVNPSTGAVIKSFASPGPNPTGLAWDGQYLWCSDPSADMIYKLDPSTWKVIESFASPWFSPYGLAWDGQYLWCADPTADMIYKLDLSTGSVIRSFASPALWPTGLAWDGQYLWCADTDTDTIYKIQP